MAESLQTWIKHVSQLEDSDTADIERLVVSQENTENVSIGFWDYEGKRSEILMPKKMAGVLARSILLCVEGSLSEIGINV